MTGRSSKTMKNMAVIEETEEKETLQTKNSNGKTPIEKPKKSKKPKKKKEQPIIEEKKKSVDIRSSLNDLKQKKEIGNTNERRDSEWCSTKKLIKKPEEVDNVKFYLYFYQFKELSFFEKIAVMFGCVKRSSDTNGVSN